MAKICIPHYRNGQFDSLREAYDELNRTDHWRSYILSDIAQYNIFYRDIWRQLGCQVLKETMIREVPELERQRDSFEYIDRVEAEGKGKALADYDIQCYDIHDSITILGHTFHGLAEIQSLTEISGTPSMNQLLLHKREGVIPSGDIHVGELYDGYPIFDSYDLGDDRTYQNYIFRKAPITDKDMEAAFQVSARCDYCMVHENIPPALLPILYYRGEGDYLLLATEKEKRFENGGSSVSQRITPVFRK